MSEETSPLVDTSLIDAMMEMTLEERLEQNDRMIQTILRLREAVRLADPSGDAERE